VLPELANIEVLDGFDSSGKAKLRAPKRPVTLRHLLTHTSGFSYSALNANIDRYQKEHGIPPFESRMNASLKIPLAFDPGEQWEYGIGIDWAGKAVEAVSGMRLGQYMKRHVLDPLGMKDTGFAVTEAQRHRLASVYLRSPRGLQPIDRETPPNAEFESGGGGLYSTIEDYLKFAQMILHNGAFEGRQILRPETVALMRQNSIGNVRVRALRAISPEGTNPVEFIEGMKWGLSFLINPEPLPTGRAAGSLAWSGVMNSYFWIDHTRGVTGVYATQILPFFDANAVKLYDEFEAAVYRAIA
jgi:methyl acetate hydrolase